MIEEQELFIDKAMFSIRPNASYRMGKTYDSLHWLSKDQVKPTEAEFDTALANIQSEYSAQEYARNRQEEYPSNGDQWDMIYKDMKNSTTTHADAVEVVKTKWPKDNSGPVD